MPGKKGGSSYAPSYPTWGGFSSSSRAALNLMRTALPIASGFYGTPGAASALGAGLSYFGLPNYFGNQPTSQYSQFRGDTSSMPKFGGWAWGNVPVDNVIKAGFDWFEVGYPESVSPADYARMQEAGIRPFAYINLGELDPSLAGQAHYTGPVLRQNGQWGTQLVDVTNPSWQDWIYRRAGEAYNRGARGIKWDVATPDIPPGKTRQDVNNAIATMMQRIRSSYPDLYFIYNQGFEFAKAYPQFVNGVETEGLFSASSYPSAYLQPWQDPWYWGPQYQDAKALANRGIPILAAEYTDPWGQRAKDLYNAIAGQGFVPYITSENWQTRGYGYGINPGW